MEHITSANFEEKVQNADNPVIVDFYADWCGPCKRLAPDFEALSQEVDGVDFYKLDVESETQLAMRFNVRSIPTLIVFKGGDEAERVMGLMPKAELKKVLEKHK